MRHVKMKQGTHVLIIKVKLGEDSTYDKKLWPYMMADCGPKPLKSLGLSVFECIDVCMYMFILYTIVSNGWIFCCSIHRVMFLEGGVSLLWQFISFLSVTNFNKHKCRRYYKFMSILCKLSTPHSCMNANDYLKISEYSFIFRGYNYDGSVFLS